jgi:hypothetical protein
MSHRLPIWVSNTIFICFIFILSVYALLSFESQKLKQAYIKLPSPLNASFATIQEISRVKNRYPIVYQCHYVFSLQDGSLSEASETIPYKIYKKLKLGDPIEIYRKEILLFGRKIALSKISENDEVPPLIENLERFFRGGVAFFAILVGLSTLFRAWGLQFQTYLSQRK